MFSSWPHLSSSDTSILCFLLTVVQSYLLFLFCFGFFSQGKVWNKKLKKDLTSQVSVTCIPPFISWPRWFFFFFLILLYKKYIYVISICWGWMCLFQWTAQQTGQGTWLSTKHHISNLSSLTLYTPCTVCWTEAIIVFLLFNWREHFITGVLLNSINPINEGSVFAYITSQEQSFLKMKANLFF